MSLRSYVGATPQFKTGTQAINHARENGTTLLSQLAKMRIISEETSRAIVENLIDGASLSIGLVFVFTPTFMTRLGILYVGYALPINSSLRSLSDSGTENGRIFWLKYWVRKEPPHWHRQRSLTFPCMLLWPFC